MLLRTPESAIGAPNVYERAGFPGARGVSSANVTPGEIELPSHTAKLKRNAWRSAIHTISPGRHPDKRSAEGSAVALHHISVLHIRCTIAAMHDHCYFTYIMATRSHTLYVGVTSNLK